MGLESAGFISELDPANPAGGDIKGLGDNHLRMIKLSLRQQFPNFTPIAVNATCVELNYLVGLTSNAQTQLDSKVASLNAALTGTPTAPTAAFGTSTTQIATTAFVAAQAFSLNLPGQLGNTGKYLRTNGTVATWEEVVLPEMKQRAIAGADTLVLTDRQKVLHYTATSNSTLALPAAATAGDGLYCTLRNASNTDWTIDPNAAELICGQATVVVRAGYTGVLRCDGTAWDILWIKQRTYSLQQLTQVTSNTSETIPADTYVRREYATGAGSVAVNTTRCGAGGGMAYGDLPVKPGDTLTRTFTSGNVVVAVNGVAMLTANAASGATGGTASKHASVTNGGAFAGGAGTALGGGSDGAGASSGSPLGVGVAGATGQKGGSGWGGAGGDDGGGGTGGAAANGRAGRAVSAVTISAEPLLSLLTGTPGMVAYSAASTCGGDGGPGAGGGKGYGSGVGNGGRGGIGAGAISGGSAGPAGVAGVLYFKEV